MRANSFEHTPERIPARSEPVAGALERIFRSLRHSLLAGDIRTIGSEPCRASHRLVLIGWRPWIAWPWITLFAHGGGLRRSLNLRMSLRLCVGGVVRFWREWRRRWIRRGWRRFGGRWGCKPVCQRLVPGTLRGILGGAMSGQLLRGLLCSLPGSLKLLGAASSVLCSLGML